MKTLEQIKDEVANEYGHPCYEEYENEMMFYSSCVEVNEIARRFAKEVAREALRNAADKAVTKTIISFSDNPNDSLPAVFQRVDKDSITNESNIPKL